jgi:hypothetical protein
MAHRPAEISRRALGQILVAAPFATALGADDAGEKTPPSAEARFIASQEAGLSAAERERLQKSITEGEKPLRVIREFKLSADVAPAFRFEPLKSRR